MNITINGKETTVPEKIILASLIKEKCPNPDCVIAEINEKIIQRKNWSGCKLQDGDKIELVTFVGGG